MSDDEVSLGGGLFEEPEDFRPPPLEAHFVSYERKVSGLDPSEISLRLVGKSPLWGHLLWNAGKYTADYLDSHAEELIRGKNVLELGAASALPSLICGINGAKAVVSTDYPDVDLIDNIQYNIDHCPGIENTVVKGYIWGNEYDPLVESIPQGEKYDLIILADLVFNHTEHLKLLKTCKDNISKNGRCFVVFSPHRPKLLDKDLEFFDTAEQMGFRVEKENLQVWKPMFEEDDETIEIRSRVYSYFLYPNW